MAPFRFIPLALALAAQPAAAADSLYSDLDLKACAKAGGESEETCCTWTCKGIDGYGVRVAEGDLRSFVGFGPDAERQCAARQTFGGFNSLGPRVEWRVENGKPYATILRWFVESEGKRKNWLVVTRIGEGEACHVAYVEGGLKDANLIARKFADEVAPRFDCAIGLPAVRAKLPMTPDELASPVPCGEP